MPSSSDCRVARSRDCLFAGCRPTEANSQNTGFNCRDCLDSYARAKGLGMSAFRLGDRVELISCPDFPGTVTGFDRGRVLVQFDDFRNEPPKAFRPDSLQLSGRRVRSA